MDLELPVQGVIAYRTGERDDPVYDDLFRFCVGPIAIPQRNRYSVVRSSEPLDGSAPSNLQRTCRSLCQRLSRAGQA